MSAQNISPVQFKDHVKVFRGLHETNPESLKQDNLGMHWTSRKKTAESIAHGFYAADEHADQSEMPEHSLILEGYTHKDNVVKRGTPEHKQLAEQHEIYFNHVGNEKEVTIRKGAQVHLIRVHHYDHTKDHQLTSQTFKSPVQGKA
jgi:hypothetical protein